MQRATAPITHDVPLHRFLNQARTAPPLDDEQERILLDRAQVGDREAVDVLVDANLRLVAETVTGGAVNENGLGLRDLCDEGTVALIAAVREYAEDRHGSFRRHVERRVRRAMQQASN